MKIQVQDNSVSRLPSLPVKKKIRRLQDKKMVASCELRVSSEEIKYKISVERGAYRCGEQVWDKIVTRCEVWDANAVMND